jgi:cell division septal protein FtsQ
MLGKSSPYLARRAKKFKKVKKDYQHKSLHNPFFHQRHKTDRDLAHKNRQPWLMAALLVFLLTLLYLFFLSPLFALRQVRVQGLIRITEDNLTKFAWDQSLMSRAWLFKQKNLFFFDIDQLSNTLHDNFSFGSLRVYKQWPNTLVISVGERDLAFIWQDDKGKFFSDQQGCLIREALVAEGDENKYPVLTSNSLNYLNEQDCLDVDETYLKAIFSLYSQMKDSPDLQPSRFLLESSENTIKADLSAGPNILFNVKEDLSKQINKLLIIKKEKELLEFQSLEYIDLRYGDRAYFK